MNKYYLRKKISNPIVLYHSTFSKIPNKLKNGIHNVTPSNFETQLKWIKSNYDIQQIDELFKQKNNFGKCAITFDDAYLSVFKEAIPILLSLNIPATIFINTSSLFNKIFWRDKVRYIINNNQVRDFVKKEKNFCQKNNINESNFYRCTKNKFINSKLMEKKIDNYLNKNESKIELICQHTLKKKSQLIESELITYGNHTHSHYLLSSLSKEEQKIEIYNAHKILKELIPENRISKIFSIPFGGLESFNSDTIEILKELKYEGALLSRDRINFDLIYKNDTGYSFPLKDRFMAKENIKSFKKHILKLKINYLRNLIFK